MGGCGAAPLQESLGSVVWNRSLERRLLGRLEGKVLGYRLGLSDPWQSPGPCYLGRTSVAGFSKEKCKLSNYI